MREGTVCVQREAKPRTVSQPRGREIGMVGPLTVSGYVMGRLNLIDNDFKMRDTPCPLTIAVAFSGPPISFPSVLIHSIRACR